MKQFIKQTWPVFLMLSLGWTAATIICPTKTKGQTVESVKRVDTFTFGEPPVFVVKGLLHVKDQKGKMRFIRPERPEELEIILTTGDGKNWKNNWLALPAKQK